MSSSNFLRQLPLNSSFDSLDPSSKPLDQKSYTKELQEFRESLLKSSSAWPQQLDTVASPLPVLIPRHLEEHIEKLGDCLVRAVTNIVERWWSDEKARLWERMPILDHQEAVLRWIEGPGKHIVEPFATRRGAWRPDFLLNFQEKDFPKKPVSSAIQICEINARFAFNGFWITAYAHEAYQAKSSRNPHLESPVDPAKIFAAYKGLVDVKKPVHILKGDEDGLDIHLFASHLENHFGIQVRFIKPADLRLVPRKTGKSGHTLCCVVNPTDLSESSEDFRSWRLISKGGEMLEQVFQVGLELHQREMEDLGLEMLKALAPICFNDLRTIYLVHDKRMLGVVLQELVSLVDEHYILSEVEAEILRNGIVPTAIAGSAETKALLSLARTGLVNKDHFIFKPIGSGKGKGILFGSDLRTEEFMSSLQRLSNHQSVDGVNYVVQRVIRQPQFDLVIPQNNGMSETKQHYFVGTFMMVGGEQLGIGCWRSSAEKICAVSRGGTWMCSLMLDESKINKSPTSKSNIPSMAVPNLSHFKDPSAIRQIHKTLHQSGILLLRLKFDDPKSDYLLNMIQALVKHHDHMAPLSHSAKCGYFWDVKPEPAKNSIPFLARSQTQHEFPWHTDCSYAKDPPRFFGLHVLQADRCGGGTLSVLHLTKVLQKLGKETVTALCASEYEIVVPPEFADGIDSIVGPVLTNAALKFFDEDADLGTIELAPRIRYRSDILKALTKRAAKALVELTEVLARARDETSDMCLHLDPSLLPNGTIVLLDNGRWLHARNQVKDSERHLRRIRWDAREF